jgi:branched-chain amino acid transport system substrate-binding protein
MKGTAPATNEQFLANLREFAPDLGEVRFAPQVFDCVDILARSPPPSREPTTRACSRTRSWA